MHYRIGKNKNKYIIQHIIILIIGGPTTSIFNNFASYIPVEYTSNDRRPMSIFNIHEQGASIFIIFIHGIKKDQYDIQIFLKFYILNWIIPKLYINSHLIEQLFNYLRYCEIFSFWDRIAKNNLLFTICILTLKSLYFVSNYL